ncbi:hypothetical protein PHLCEN_2v9531 [Hermanssonia centrifuga]|uniref:SHSP domain-containing protein n=1 Tax=Hermanssonia centrifuga TaxID=98765 RepID=A0A2R6NQI5_9APHY|nr:hypothetical protein PHLCEN_2v9531 [Hermanssonia centrifuga]
MSLARQFFREFRPFFHMLEEPLGRSPAYMGFPRNRSLLDDPFFRHPESLRPAVDVTEHGNNYVVEAEVPGVKKENLQVRVGDGGRSVTIEGNVVERRGVGAGAEATQSADGTNAVATKSDGNQISTERSLVGTSSFSRTVWLPRRVDSSNVSAKLDDGVLTLTLPKAEDPESINIQVQ